MLLALATMVCGLGLYLFGKSNLSTPTGHRAGNRARMLMAMVVPFAAEVCLDSLIGNKLLAVWSAIGLMPMMAAAVLKMVDVMDLAEWVITATMSAGMAAMMEPMVAQSVIGALLGACLVGELILFQNMAPIRIQLVKPSRSARRGRAK